jgi:ABC-type dipeptide/oligopeptide/nickel transport system ATPase subunit
MTYTIRPAIRSQTPLLIGLVGPSGSGKTFSALRLATGIQSVAGGGIVGIDTEARRMLHYADKFKFEHMEFKAPFGSLNYLDAIAAAIKHGAKTIIVDSMSHEHEGAGGYLETHETELDRIAGDDWKKRAANNFTAWIKPAGNRRKLINAMLQFEANFIFCFRAKEKLSLVKREGKTEPVPIGWQAIAGEEFVYEMLIRCLLLPGAKGLPDWSEESMKHGVPKISDGVEAVFSKAAKLDEDIGARLARWAAGAPPEQRRDSPAPKTGGAFAEDEPEGPPRVSVDQALALEAACTEHGVSADAFKKQAGVARFDEVLAADFENAKKWIAKQAKRRESAPA